MIDQELIDRLAEQVDDMPQENPGSGVRYGVFAPLPEWKAILAALTAAKEYADSRAEWDAHPDSWGDAEANLRVSDAHFALLAHFGGAQ